LGRSFFKEARYSARVFKAMEVSLQISNLGIILTPFSPYVQLLGGSRSVRRGIPPRWDIAPLQGFFGELDPSPEQLGL
jgi:hypothetical protein